MRNENALTRTIRTEMEVTTGFGMAVVNFAIDGFNGAMNRKTWTENDEKALEALKAMVKALEEKRA